MGRKQLRCRSTGKTRRDGAAGDGVLGEHVALHQEAVVLFEVVQRLPTLPGKTNDYYLSTCLIYGHILSIICHFPTHGQLHFIGFFK